MKQILTKLEQIVNRYREQIEKEKLLPHSQDFTEIQTELDLAMEIYKDMVVPKN